MSETTKNIQNSFVDLSMKNSANDFNALGIMNENKYDDNVRELFDNSENQSTSPLNYDSGNCDSISDNGTDLTTSIYLTENDIDLPANFSIKCQEKNLTNQDFNKLKNQIESLNKSNNWYKNELKIQKKLNLMNLDKFYLNKRNSILEKQNLESNCNALLEKLTEMEGKSKQDKTYLVRELKKKLIQRNLNYKTKMLNSTDIKFELRKKNYIITEQEDLIKNLRTQRQNLLNYTQNITNSKDKKILYLEKNLILSENQNQNFNRENQKIISENAELKTKINELEKKLNENSEGIFEKNLQVCNLKVLTKSAPNLNEQHLSKEQYNNDIPEENIEMLSNSYKVPVHQENNFISKSMQTINCNRNLKSQSAQTEKFEVNFKSKSAQTEKFDGNFKSKSAQTEKFDCNFKSKSAQTEKFEENFKSKSAQTEKFEGNFKYQSAQTENFGSDLKSQSAQTEEFDVHVGYLLQSSKSIDVEQEINGLNQIIENKVNEISSLRKQNERIVENFNNELIQERKNHKNIFKCLENKFKKIIESNLKLENESKPNLELNEMIKILVTEKNDLNEIIKSLQINLNIKNLECNYREKQFQNLIEKSKINNKISELNEIESFDSKSLSVTDEMYNLKLLVRVLETEENKKISRYENHIRTLIKKCKIYKMNIESLQTNYENMSKEYNILKNKMNHNTEKKPKQILEQISGDCNEKPHALNQIHLDDATKIKSIDYNSLSELIHKSNNYVPNLNLLKISINDLRNSINCIIESDYKIPYDNLNVKFYKQKSLLEELKEIN